MYTDYNKSCSKSKPGFTLIELLVVIAIIGLLAGVVSIPLFDLRKKGADVAVKSNLHSARIRAELFADDNNGRYTGFCTDTAADRMLSAAVLASRVTIGTVKTLTTGGAYNKAVCHDSANQYMIAVPLSDSVSASKALFWCIDSDGTAKEINEIPSANETLCPS